MRAMRVATAIMPLAIAALVLAIAASVAWPANAWANGAASTGAPSDHGAASDRGVDAGVPQREKVGDLLAHAGRWDDKQVTILGEVVGDVMRRSGGAWVNVSDGSGVIGVWLPRGEAENIHVAGRYCRHGDTVSVTGRFLQADSRSGGETDIRGGTLVVEKRGYDVPRPPAHGRFRLGMVLCVLAAFLYLFGRFRTALRDSDENSANST